MSAQFQIENIDPEVRKAGLALALWLEDNLKVFISPQLTENDGPAIRLCAMEADAQAGWREVFPTQDLPAGIYGISIRFRALADNESVTPDKHGIILNNIRFVAEIFTTYEERFFIMRIVDSAYRLIAEPISDEDIPEAKNDDVISESVLLIGGQILTMLGLPLFRDIR